MKNIPSKEENPKGLYRKYSIRKFTGKYRNTFFDERVEITEPVDEDSEYFVLRLDENGSDKNHIKACRIAIHAYADAIEKHLPELSKDLKERYPLF